jgi:hypothetical protein
MSKCTRECIMSKIFPTTWLPRSALPMHTFFFSCIDSCIDSENNKY